MDVIKNTSNNMYNGESILNEIASMGGLVDKLLGDKTDLVLTDEKKEKVKSLLIDVCGYSDVNLVFKKSIDRGMFKEFMGTVFRFMGGENEKKSILGNKD